MTPVDCEFEHDPPRQNGDCLRACVASLLDLPLSEVPHFSAHTEGWFLKLGLWLQARGICIATLYGPQHVDTYHLALGLSNGLRHAVVMRNNVTVHNPARPSRAHIAALERAVGERCEGLCLVEHTFVFLPISEVISKVYSPTGDHAANLHLWPATIHWSPALASCDIQRIPIAT